MWIDKGKPPHYCPKPGWFERRREKIHVGAAWKCDECGIVWYWVNDQWDTYWSTTAPPKGTKEPILKSDGTPNPPPDWPA